MIRKAVLMGLLAGGLMIAASEAVAKTVVAVSPSVREGIGVELGRRDFRNYCAACHGVEGTGDGTLAEFLTLSVPDLTKLTKKNAGIFPREKVLGMIDGRADVKIHGPRDMPVWGDWFETEAAAETDAGREARAEIVRERIESLVTYLQTIQVK